MPIPVSTQRRINAYNYLVRRVSWLVRQPHETFVSFLCAVGGAPLMFHRVQTSSLESVLPSWVVMLWGLVLTIGSLSTLYGLIRAERKSIKEVRLEGSLLMKTEILTVEALPYRRVEYYGLTLLMWAAVIYNITIMMAVGLAAAPASPIILAFALTSGFRAFVVHVEIDMFKVGIGVPDERR